MSDRSYGDGLLASRPRGPREGGVREVVAAEPGALEEEFLYHLSRGSEFLIANQVVEAKEELERALSYQPQDARSQDLLASVYFRLGVYPRAIEIWTGLVEVHGDDIALRVNLGLALLKTAQPEQALGHLARAVAKDPTHERAWRYVGLAEWRVGNLDRAREAFLRGGQASMARRMEEMLGSSAGHVVSHEAAPYIDAAKLSLAPPAMTRSADSDTAHESHGHHAQPAEHRVDEVISVLLRPEEGVLRRTLAPAPLPSMAPADLTPSEPPARSRASVLPQALLGSHAERASPPEPGSMEASVQGGSDALLAQELFVLAEGQLVLRPHRAIFARKSGLRALVGAFPTETVPRRVRLGAEDGVLGDQDPFFRFAGQRSVHFGLPSPAGATPTGERFELLRLEGETLYVAERALFGFDEQLAYESGHLPASAGPSARLVQLRGHGVCALRLERALHKLVVMESDEVRVLAQALVGWSGRLYPGEEDERWISLRGEGAVFFT